MNEQKLQLVKGSLPQKRPAPTSTQKAEVTEKEIQTLFAERITPERQLLPMEPLFRMSDCPCFLTSAVLTFPRG